jgi:hypothetical protein
MKMRRFHAISRDLYPDCYRKTDTIQILCSSALTMSWIRRTMELVTGRCTEVEGDVCAQ